jgi:hypothetical protein
MHDKTQPPDNPRRPRDLTWIDRRRAELALLTIELEAFMARGEDLFGRLRDALAS